MKQYDDPLNRLNGWLRESLFYEFGASNNRGFSTRPTSGLLYKNGWSPLRDWFYINPIKRLSLGLRCYTMDTRALPLGINVDKCYGLMEMVGEYYEEKYK